LVAAAQDVAVRAPPIFIESLIGRDSPQDFSAGIQPVITASAGDNLAAKNLQ
jgi:hypothetical protein